MKRHIRRIALVAFVVMCIYGWGIVTDSQALHDELLRLHVVGASNSVEDQEVKLRVRDAVLGSIREDLQQMADVSAARDYIRENLPKIQSVANETLEMLGVDQRAVATFCKETFDVRHYDTFSLPSGVYDSLRIVIGEGAGHNWWCVTFPTLCLPATTEGFEAVAADAGLSSGLTRTLSRENDFELRFLLLDKLGRLRSSRSAGK